MKKIILFLTLFTAIHVSCFAVTINVTIDAIGSPAKAGFSMTAVTLATGDVLSIKNNTSITILLGIQGLPSTLPLTPGMEFPYSPTGAGFGTVTVTLTSSNPVTLPSNNIPLVITEATSTTVDTDKDGIPDIVEVTAGLDPLNKDTDGDGVDDGVEVGIPNYDMDPSTQTDPLKDDTDGGALKDGQEDKNGNGKFEANLGETDPKNPADDIITSLYQIASTDTKTMLFPQPATDIMYVNNSGSYTISDNLGSIVQNGVLTSNVLNVSILKSGIYFLNFTTGTYKFVVK